MAAWAAYKAGEALSVTPASRAAAIAWRASLISCTGAPRQPTRQTTPTKIAMRRIMAVRTLTIAARPVKRPAKIQCGRNAREFVAPAQHAREILAKCRESYR